MYSMTEQLLFLKILQQTELIANIVMKQANNTQNKLSKDILLEK